MRCAVGQVTIDILPDDVHLDIFDMYGGDDDHFPIRMWVSLVHVCRRWRRIVFASPRRLRLVLECDARTSVSKLLDTWPPLPITIRYSPVDAIEGEENIITTLELRDRITGITFDKLRGSENLERFSTTPFPALTRLDLVSERRFHPGLIFPEAFLGGSAPQLRSFTSYSIKFVELPNVVLSATHLVKLTLLQLGPPVARCCASPEMMVTCLAAFPTLEEFSVGFRWQAPAGRPDPISPPHRTRVILPALTHFHFEGASEYLEDFVSRIDTPLLDALEIVFFQAVTLHIQQLHGLIRRAESFKPLKKAYIGFYSCDTCTGITPRSHTRFLLGIRGHGSWAIGLMAQLCKDLSPLFSHLEWLQILGDLPFPSASPGNVTECGHWLNLFHPFPAVRILFVSKKFARRVSPVLQAPTQSGERPTDVLPALRVVVLEDSSHLALAGSPNTPIYISF